MQFIGGQAMNHSDGEKVQLRSETKGRPVLATGLVHSCATVAENRLQRGPIVGG